MIPSLRAGLARRFVLIAGSGLLGAVLVALAGAALERQRFGASTEASFTRIEDEVRLRFEASAATLAAISSAGPRRRERTSPRPRATPARPGILFDGLDQAVPEALASTTGVTVYDATLSPVAWAGLVFDLPQTRPGGAGPLFIQADAFGPRLVRIESLIDRNRAVVSRTGLIVAEQRLGEAGSPQGPDTTFTIPTLLAPVTVMTSEETTAPHAVHSFVIRTAGGPPLANA